MQNYIETVTDDGVLAALREVCAAFRLPGEMVGASLITRGNINTTYKVDFYNPGAQDLRERRKSYLAQEVNAYVFRNPKQIMVNIDRVTSHIRDRHPGQTQLHFHHTSSNKNYYFGKKGAFWRVMNYIESVTFDSCENETILRGCGKAFGLFQRNLVDLDPTCLYETIPNFHNTSYRYNNFVHNVSEDPFERCDEVRPEIEAVLSFRAQATVLSTLLSSGRIPLRVTHNDTKVNNVLFDATTLEPIVVIDLDTVMPGLSVYDFGDAVRFAASDGAEDERDLSLARLNLGKFRAITQGFLEGAGGILQEIEIEAMPLGALTLTVELGMRFLEDYITGDPYFRTSYPRHNLVRARAQLALAADMRDKMDEMKTIVEDVAASLAAGRD